MPLLNWDEKLSVNIKEIDEQHKKLIEMLNTLHEAMSKGNSKNILGGIVAEMFDYTKYHFSTEEKLMVKYNYFDRHTHRQEHEKFIEQVDQYIDNYKKGSMLLSVEILTFLSTWVNNHITGTDKKYANYLNSQGVY